MLLATFPKDFPQAATSQARVFSHATTSQARVFSQVATFKMLNFPNGNFPSLSRTQR